MANGRFRSILLNIFRVLQLILSVVAFGCGIYIIYTMYNIAESAKILEEAIKELPRDEDGVEVLQDSLLPVLRNLQGTPARSFIITAVALWSMFLIVYLFFAHRSSRTSQRDLRRNSRTCRILLSIITLGLWIAAIVCAALLVIQYGVFAVTLGPQTKIAFTILKEILLEALQQATKDSKAISNGLNIVSRIMTVGAMSIVVLVSSIVCATIALVDCFVACCVSGKSAHRGIAQSYGANLEKGGAQSVVTPVSAYNSPYQH